jgi:hypothetical protein
MALSIRCCFDSASRCSEAGRRLTYSSAIFGRAFSFLRQSKAGIENIAVIQHGTNNNIYVSVALVCIKSFLCRQLLQVLNCFLVFSILE